MLLYTCTLPFVVVIANRSHQYLINMFEKYGVAGVMNLCSKSIVQQCKSEGQIRIAAGKLSMAISVKVKNLFPPVVCCA